LQSEDVAMTMRPTIFAVLLAAATAREYAGLSGTCVGCHAVYREGRRSPRAALGLGR
jgi:hypothetical protein